MAEIGIQGEGVVLDQVQQKKEDHAVEELLTGQVPLLDRGDADGEEHHEDRAADERDAGEDAKDERETEYGFEERDGVAEAEDEAVWEGRLREMFGRGSGEGANAVVRP